MEVAASLVAFIEIAGSGVNLSIQAKQLWDRVQDAPENIAHLVQRLQLHQALFAEMEARVTAKEIPVDLWNDSVARLAIERAKTAKHNLQSVVNELNDGLRLPGRYQRTLAEFRVVAKDKKLERLETRLSHSLELLNQCFLLVIPSWTAELVAVRLRAMFRDHNHTLNRSLKFNFDPETIKTSDVHVADKSRHLCLAHHPGRHPQQSPVSKGARKKRIQLYIPGWATQKALEILYSPNHYGRDFGYRVYNIVPHDAEVIYTVQRGDVERLQYLFSTRKACLYDQDTSGNSLLHHAADRGHYNMCSFLLQAGLCEQLNHQVGGSLESPLTEVTFNSKTSRRNETDWGKLAKLFLAYLDPTEPLIPTKLFHFLPFWSYGDTFLRAFLKLFAVRGFSMDGGVRFEAVRLGSFIVADVLTLQALLNTGDKVSEADVHCSTLEKFSLVHSAAISFAIRFPDEILPFQRGVCYQRLYHPDRLDFVTRVASRAGGDDLHALEQVILWDAYGVPDWRGTPLISILGAALCFMTLNASMAHWDKVFQSTLREWLEALKAARVDLLAYGQRELEIMAAHPEDMKGSFDSFALERSHSTTRPHMVEGIRLSRHGMSEGVATSSCDLVPLRIISLRIGKEPDQWELLWAPEFETMARQFWQALDEPILEIPGSWPGG